MSHPALSAGNVAVITGGASGIGLAAAKRFASLGLKVCIADREGLNEARDALGGGVLAIETDVSDRGSIEALAARVASELGSVSVLDIIENRPALSRWHPDFADIFAADVAG